jgi:hypothetical protein
MSKTIHVVSEWDDDGGEYPQIAFYRQDYAEKYAKLHPQHECAEIPISEEDPGDPLPLYTLREGVRPHSRVSVNGVDFTWGSYARRSHNDAFGYWDMETRYALKPELEVTETYETGYEGRPGYQIEVSGPDADEVKRVLEEKVAAYLEKVRG